MALGMELRLRMAQQLVMTPQLQLAIRLLQMSNLELDEFLQEELDKNPLLEKVDDDSETTKDLPEDYEMLSAMQQHNEQEFLPEVDPFAPDAGDVVPHDRSLEEDLPALDASWTDIYEEGITLSHSGQSSNDAGEGATLENTFSVDESLLDHLVWQLNLSALISERERSLGLLLIDAIDDNGYLLADLESLASQSESTVDELEDVLILIQSFDPPGVGARNLAECLLIQLKAKAMARHPYATLLENLEDLAKRDYRKLCRKLKLSEEELSAAIAVIQSLNPKPGLAFGSDTARYIVADVIVRRNHRSEWVVEMNPEMAPKLRVNAMYQNLGRSISTQDQKFMSEHYRSARWLIKSLEQRSSTIFRVAESIVRFQTDFLEHGPEFLRPLILKDVADDIGVHESTISRVTSNKYIHTPRGIFELKYFFSSSLAGGLGTTHSSESVRHKIRKLIDEESVARPYSDEQIVDLLKSQSITVARRTVAKYREAMGILPSSKRKRL